MKNALVGQSGGPTSVINSSLAGVFESCKHHGADKVYGMKNGIQGFIDGNVCLLDGKLKNPLDIELLKRTPSSFLGSCRYKLPDNDASVYEKIFDNLDRYNIGYFFYIGGNDSMDTIAKLTLYARKINSDIKFIGVPKTIDNDLMCTDHTPGYGSAAKYIAGTMKEIILDASVYDKKSVTVVEIMGRNAGWLTGAAALAASDDCDGADMIFLPEIPFDVEHFTEAVNEKLKMKNTVVIAVSEGVKLADGRYVCELSDDVRNVDAFGHTALTGTARYLANLLARKLSVKTRSIELSVLQRCAGHITSRTDITEAYQVGGAAVVAAFNGESGKMVCIKRIFDAPYQVTTSLCDIFDIANYEKKVPAQWIDPENFNLKPEFLTYVRPLIQAEITPIFVEGLPRHIKL